MAELARRMNNRQRVLAYLQQHRTCRNVDLVAVGGLRYGARLFELQRDHVIDIVHEDGPIWRIDYHGPRVPTQASINWELAS